MDGIINIKVILLGEAGVGKTSVLLRFKNGEFRESTKQTFIDYHAKKIKVRDKEVTLSVWDTAGQEQFRSIVRSYYRQADGVLLLYDVTNVTTFHVLTGWLSDLRSNNEHAKVIIVGNKNENPAKKSVAVSAVKSFAQQEGLDYQEVSAKSGANIDKVFLLLVEKILIEKGILPPLNETTSLPTRAAPPPPVQSPVSTKSTEPETNPIETNSSSAENNIKLHNELSPDPRNKKKGCC